MMQPLTKRQHQVYEFLARFIHERGYAPSLQEICDQLGLRSLATVHKHLDHLRVKGWIARHHSRSRSVTLKVDLAATCPVCGRLFDETLDKAKVSIEKGRKLGENKSVEFGTAIPPST